MPGEPEYQKILGLRSITEIEYLRILKLKAAQSKSHKLGVSKWTIKDKFVNYSGIGRILVGYWSDIKRMEPNNYRLVYIYLL